MIKKLALFAGGLLLIASILIYLYTSNRVKEAKNLDKSKTSYGMISSEFAPCIWEAKTPERVMSENTSQSIVVSFTGRDQETCQSFISLRAPGFDISPLKEQQEILLPPGAKGSISWIISPRKSGTYEIAASDEINTKIFGISVTNVFGLNPMQAQAASVIGTIFGPMMTVPWWWERFRERKKKQQPAP